MTAALFRERLLGAPFVRGSRRVVPIVLAQSISSRVVCIAEALIFLCSPPLKGHGDTKSPPVFKRAESFFLPRKNLPAFYIDATAARVDDVICQKNELAGEEGRDLHCQARESPIIFNNEGF